MAREVRIVFEVRDTPEADALTRQELYDLAEQLVAEAEPDLPVLTFDRIEITD